METETSLTIEGDKNKEIMDLAGIEKEVGELWGLSQRVDGEANGPIRTYRRVVGFLTGNNGDEQFYGLVVGMQDRMNALNERFSRLRAGYRQRADSMLDFLLEQQEKQETQTELKKGLSAKIGEKKRDIDKTRVELEGKNGGYKLCNRMLLSFIEKNDMESLERSLEGTMDLRRDITGSAAADLLYSGRVHGVLAGFCEQMSLLSGYFERAIGMKMYEIQLGRLTEQTRKQLSGFGKMMNEFYSKARAGLVKIKSLEKGNLLDLSLDRKTTNNSGSSFDDIIVRYIGKGA